MGRKQTGNWKTGGSGSTSGYYHRLHRRKLLLRNSGQPDGSYLIGKPAQSGKSSGRYGQTYRFGSESGTPAYYQRYRTFGKSCCQHHAAKQLWWRRTCKLIGRRRQLQWKDAIHLSTTYQRFGNLWLQALRKHRANGRQLQLWLGDGYSMAVRFRIKLYELRIQQLKSK